LLIVPDTIIVPLISKLTSQKEEIILQLPIGQKVVHPIHGIGKITDVTKLNILDGFSHYYVIDFLTKNLTSHIPVKNTEGIGLRIAMSTDMVDQVLDILRAVPEGLPEHFKLRKKLISDLTQSGRPTKIALAVRELTWRKTSGRLSASDIRILSLGRDMLSEEIALVMDCSTLQVKQDIDLALQESIEAGQAGRA
jgi:CarD family transcriptional regulator